jgi:2-iminobutanoate/2-iminopropanoate deaminase
MHAISTGDAPIPAGHYSQAIVHAGLVYVAGQLPIDPADPEREPGDAGEQTAQALRNVAAVLAAAGSGLHRLLQVTIYVSDMTLWPLVNQAYAQALGEHRPARAVVPTQAFRRGYQVEIQAVAAVEE